MQLKNSKSVESNYSQLIAILKQNLPRSKRNKREHFVDQPLSIIEKEENLNKRSLTTALLLY